ncbi:MAG: energy-coupling factor transporter transmembrane component T [Eubacteriales bacterium]|nr:energy-coupling factor transporter transmembrane component T [bacterium]MDY2791867.1 energy-coupling factor transporter transmembrane component T [Eubacteriales bacterium]
MVNITLGQYFPGTSPLHRLDPRAKILLTIALIAAVFVASSLPAYALVFLFIAGMAALSRIDVKFMVKGLKPVFFVIIFTFVLNLFFTTGGNTLLSWKFIKITDQGLKSAGFMALRLVLLILGTQLLTLTTSPIALTDGIESLLKPLSKIGFPAHELAMMMSIALRFIPTLMEETDKIMKAQMARGADFETGNLVQKAKSMLPLLVPLFVSAFRRADELAMAMEARCYRGGEHRTRMKQLRFTRLDALAALVMAALLAAVIVL